MSAIDLSGAQSLVERLMTDRCRVLLDDGEPVWDQSTLSYVTPPATVVHADLECMASMNPGEGTRRERVDVGRDMAEWPARLLVPLATVGIEPGMRVEVTESRDPEMVGRDLWVGAVGGGTYAVARPVGLTFEQPVAPHTESP